MDKIKEPSMILASLDAVAILGVATYFHRKIDEMKENQTKITRTLSHLVNKMNEMEKQNQGNTQSFQEINNTLKSLQENLVSSAKVDEVDDLDLDINAIVQSLAANNIEVARPSLEPRYDPRMAARGRALPPASNRRVAFEEEDLSSARTRSYRGSINPRVQDQRMLQPQQTSRSSTGQLQNQNRSVQNTNSVVPSNRSNTQQNTNTQQANRRPVANNQVVQTNLKRSVKPQPDPFEMDVVDENQEDDANILNDYREHVSET
jgi:hypothetical protein